MKNKLLTKILATMLTAALVMGMAACGDNAEEPSDTGSTPTNAPSNDGGSQDGDQGGQNAGQDEGQNQEEDLGPYTVRRDAAGNPIDLGGITVTIRDWSTDPDAETNDGSAYAQAREDYQNWLQETYNFKLVQKAISTYESSTEDFVNYVTEGGDDENYIFVLITADAFNAMNKGLMYDVSTLDCLDLSDAGKWHQGVKEMFSLGDKIYGCRPGDSGVGGRGVFVNKRILEDAGYTMDQLYAWQDAGQWTWDKYEEICKAVQDKGDINNDGVIDVYGMATRNTIWFEIITHTNYGAFIDKDENGNLRNALEDPNTMEALNWALDMWDKYDAHPSYAEDAAWDYFLTAFKEGKGCFYPGELWRANDFSNNMEDDIGFVAFPKGPQADGYINPVADNPWVIPGCYDEDKAWKIAFALDVWFDPIPEFETYKGYIVDNYNNFDDTESVESTVATLMESGRPTYNVLVPGLDLAADVFYVISKENTPAQIAESVRNNWQSLLDAVNNQ